MADQLAGLAKETVMPVAIETTAAAVKPTAVLATELAAAATPNIAINNLAEVQIPKIPFDAYSGLPKSKIDVAGGTNNPDGSVLKTPTEIAGVSKLQSTEHSGVQSLNNIGTEAVSPQIAAEQQTPKTGESIPQTEPAIVVEGSANPLTEKLSPIPEMQSLEEKIKDGSATASDKQEYRRLQKEQVELQEKQKIEMNREAQIKKLDAKLIAGTITDEEMSDLQKLTTEKAEANKAEAPKEKTVSEQTDDVIEAIKEDGMTPEHMIELAQLQDKSVSEVLARIDEDAQERFLETVKSTPQLLEKLRNPQERDKVQQFINEFAQASQAKALYRNAMRETGEIAKKQIEAFSKADEEYAKAQESGVEKDIQEKALLAAQEASRFRAIDKYYDSLYDAYEKSDKQMNNAHEKMLQGLGLNNQAEGLWQKIKIWLMEKIRKEVKNQIEPYIGKMRKYNLPD